MEERTLVGPPSSAVPSEPGLSELLKALSMKTVQDYRCSTAPGPDALRIRVKCAITTVNWIKPADSYAWIEAGQSCRLFVEAFYDIASSAYQVQTYSGAKSSAIATAQMLAVIHGVMNVPKALEQITLASEETSRFELELPMSNSSHKAQVLSRVEALSESTVTVHSRATLMPEAPELAAAKGAIIEYNGGSTSTFRRDDGVLLSGQARMKFWMRLDPASSANRPVEFQLTTDVTQAATESTLQPKD